MHWDVRGGGEAAVLKQIENSGVPLKEKIKAGDGTGEYEFLFNIRLLWKIMETDMS